jgi:cytochrome c peroxidase
MWDGRETVLRPGQLSPLAQQAIDATLGRAQALEEPTADQQEAIVKFETAIFNAQFVDNQADSLLELNATGGPKALSQQPFLTSTPPTPVFDLYTPWENLTGTDAVTQARLSVARGLSSIQLAPAARVVAVTTPSMSAIVRPGRLL